MSVSVVFAEFAEFNKPLQVKTVDSIEQPYLKDFGSDTNGNYNEDRLDTITAFLFALIVSENLYNNVLSIVEKSELIIKNSTILHHNEGDNLINNQAKVGEQLEDRTTEILNEVDC